MARAEAFDVVVVGAGAAGCVVARQLADAGRAVLVLEAGPDLRNATPAELRDGWNLPATPDWGLESEPDPSGATKKLRRGRLVGGTSWLTRFAVRGAAADFDAWAARGNPTWSFDEVLPIFRRIETDAEFGTKPWHGETGPLPITRYPELEPSEIHAAAVRALQAVGFPVVEDHNAPDAVGLGRLPFSATGGARVTSADAFLPSDLELPNLSIRADALVANVVIDSDRATGVRLVDGSEVEARWIVLAAGVYGSPTILLRSGLGPARDLRALSIPVIANLPGVGSNLADHPSVSIDSGWRGSAVDGPALHTIATFRSSLAGPNGAPDLLLWIADPAGPEPSFEFEALLMKPDSRGRVRLRSTDPKAPPRIALPGLREQRDIERLAEAYRLCLELANRPEIRDLARDPAPWMGASDEDLRRSVVQEQYSAPHTVGTCRMGPSSDDGDVVDAFGQVHGVECLSVIDASIIPEATAGFPHLITIMLADRLAETLATLIRDRA
jgi:choline dehydrogenase